MLTKEDVVKALPATLKSSVTQSLVDTINNVTTDPIVAENIRENFVTYASVLKDGKFKTTDYINAVSYVSYKFMNYSNEESYARTFPQRYQTLLANGTSKKDISAYVSAYHRGKLVNLILEQSLVPTWIINQDNYQKAINTQVDLMVNAISEKVRCDAANSILTHLKRPEVNGLQLNVNLQDNSGMNELKNTLAELAQQQKALIEGGMSAREIAATPLIEGEIVE
ncbi:hypothetical protein HYP99_gp087 [Sinorhizobium phage ort11]|uniref:Uncharacterized protein n=1 Tax=Sinorhizobium phage ort11 TaxID=2599764 RepID=A0A5C2H3S8_9CAUD|nr:hypothetical protein HYP99_gp087 [Sinorhizobium phage ort11]QEP29885.1 hypothetical protein Smphiort11_087 [Sinorhizobium phage ort11]